MKNRDHKNILDNITDKADQFFPHQTNSHSAFYISLTLHPPKLKKQSAITMAHQSLYLLFLVVLSSIRSHVIQVEARHLLDATLPDLPIGLPKPELPTLPMPNLPLPQPGLPTLPMPNLPLPQPGLPTLPMPNLPQPQLPNPQLPPLPKPDLPLPMPQLPKPQLPLPQLPIPLPPLPSP
ncbi:protein PELPK2 [Solanum lycopersicum]|uniref:protein PELPK2 n=1 Tax=Solanum lycopersicum TaxID=4081 RepID=UPI000532B15E|nr:protein PELPK1 [Solanum lycopersicum]